MDDDSVYRPDQFHVLSREERNVIENYLEIETEFMAVEKFYDDRYHENIRKQAVVTVGQNSKGMDAYIPYLAMNYFDRYFSRNPLPDGEKDVLDRIRLLAISCLTIAARMRIISFSVNQFLEERLLNITLQQILDMELKILSALQLRILPITPFCYLDYYYFHFEKIGGFKRRQINEIIVEGQGVPYLTRYKPSRIAFSSFVAVSKLYGDRLNGLKLDEDVERCVGELFILCKLWEKRQTATMPKSEGESENQRQSMGKAVSEVTSADDAPSETESERKIRAAKGKAIMGDTSGDVGEEILEELKQLAEGGKAVVVAGDEEEGIKGIAVVNRPISGTAPEISNVELHWPPEAGPLGQQPHRSVSARNRERDPDAASPPKSSRFNIRGFIFG